MPPFASKYPAEVGDAIAEAVVAGRTGAEILRKLQAGTLPGLDEAWEMPERTLYDRVAKIQTSRARSLRNGHEEGGTSENPLEPIRREWEAKTAPAESQPPADATAFRFPEPSPELVRRAPRIQPAAAASEPLRRTETREERIKGLRHLAEALPEDELPLLIRTLEATVDDAHRRLGPAGRWPQPA